MPIPMARDDIRVRESFCFSESWRTDFYVRLDFSAGNRPDFLVTF